jgi:hypothetical protein
VFERFDPFAQQVVARAQEEAQALGHSTIGTVHLLLGFVTRGGLLESLPKSSIRAKAQELRNRAPPVATPGQLAFEEETIAAFRHAVSEAGRLGQDDARVRPEHLLLALLSEGLESHRVLVELGADIGALRRRAAGETPGRDALQVTFGFGAPLGDMGDPQTDARVLLAMLAKGRRAADLLRAHGIDEQRVCELAGSTTTTPADVAAVIVAGGAVPVTLGVGSPMGDLGNPRTDAKLLLTMLMCVRPAADMLRAHGIDEERVRTLSARA